MLDALVDTLMALWNATWREKALPTLFAFLAVGISTCIFLMQVGLPTLSRLSSPSSPASLQGQASRSDSLAIKPHVTASVQVIAVSTPVQTGADTKNSPTPVPAPTQATTYSPAPAPMPVQLPGIVSLPDIYAYTGTTDIVSTDTTPAKSRLHESSRHSSPRKTATPVPTVAVTTVAPTATATGGTITPIPTPAPTTAAPTPLPTPIAAATPTVVVPTNVPTPTNPVPVYPATPTSASTPANTVTVSPAIVPTDTGRATGVASPTANH